MGVDLRSRLAGAAGQARNEVPKEPGTFLPPKKQARTPCMHLASTPERAVPEKPECHARPRAPTGTQEKRPTKMRHADASVQPDMNITSEGGL